MTTPLPNQRRSAVPTRIHHRGDGGRNVDKSGLGRKGRGFRLIGSGCPSTWARSVQSAAHVNDASHYANKKM